MLYPSALPLISMLQAFFDDGADTRHRLKVFYIVFGAYVTLPSIECSSEICQHFYLGALSRMDIPSSYWRLGRLPCRPEQQNGFESVWRE